MTAKPDDYVILVMGHKRARFLGHVLEGLKRENALAHTQVWIDGHGFNPDLREKVEASAELRHKYSDAKWIVYGMHGSENKLIIDAISMNIEKFNKFIVLEDDCFPVPGAISAYLSELDELEKEDGFFSVYGVPRGLPNELDGMYRFRAWAWATTATKMKRILPQLRSCLHMPEPEYLAYIHEHMTDEIRLKFQEIPEIISTADKYFSWDSALSFLTIQAGLKHRVTAKQLACNFGIGVDCSRFSSTNEKFFKPPYNMITEQDLIDQYALAETDWFSVRKVNCEKVYELNSKSAESRLLVSGWGEAESWGTWSIGGKSVMQLGCESQTDRDIQVTFRFKAFVTDKRPILKVAVRVNGGQAIDWQFKQDSWESERVLTISAEEWNRKRPAEIVFEIDEPTSPAKLGLSEDTRELGLGIMSIKLTQVPAAVAKP